MHVQGCLRESLAHRACTRPARAPCLRKEMHGHPEGRPLSSPTHAARLGGTPRCALPSMASTQCCVWDGRKTMQCARVRGEGSTREWAETSMRYPAKCPCSSPCCAATRAVPVGGTPPQTSEGGGQRPIPQGVCETSLGVQAEESIELGWQPTTGRRNMGTTRTGAWATPRTTTTAVHLLWADRHKEPIP